MISAITHIIIWIPELDTSNSLQFTMDSKKINKRDFKKGINLEDSRRRREESSIRLRKDSKCEGIAKRRNLTKVAETVSENDQGLYNDNMLGNLLLGLRSMEDQQQTNSLRSIRRLLSVEKNPPVKQCIEAGLVPILVNFLSKMNFEQQFEAAWGKHRSLLFSS